MATYSTVTVSSYNASPPSDDASEVSSNQVTWAKHKTKLGDPLKTALEAINTQLVSVLGSIDSDDIALLGTAQTFTAAKTFDEDIILDTNANILADDANGVTFRNAANDASILVLANDGGITTPNNASDEAGYKGTPVNTQDVNYTLVLADAGKTIYKSAGGAGETITIPANASVAFPIGTQIDIVNQGGGDLSIAITTDTLTHIGTGNTTTFTLADDGWAIIKKMTATAWVITGMNLGST